MNIIFRSAVVLSAIFLLIACVTAPTPVPSPTPTSLLPSDTLPPKPSVQPTGLLDGFENPTTAWKPGLAPEYTGSSALDVVLSDQHVTQGSRSLELRFDQSADSKAVFILERPIALKPEFIELDVFNPGTVKSGAIALSTGPDWKWYESPEVPLVEGKQTISFDLKAENYKTAAGKWQPQETVAALGETQRIAIILFPSAKGSLFIDNIRQSEILTGALPQIGMTGTETPPPMPARTPTHLTLTALTKSGAAFKPLELAIETDGTFETPFDPERVDIRVEFTGPGGKVLTAPAFWYQDFDPENGSPVGKAGFRVRFTPPQSGPWSATAVLTRPELRSDPLVLNIKPNPGAHGLVRRHPTNPRYFAFDDGSTFFPIGLNIGWGGKTPIQDYTRWLDSLSANGGDIIRVWMASWSFGIEWKDTPLGDYSNRLYQAWQLDQIFRLAEERGVYVELVILNHGAFSAQVNPEWQDNPYNIANGGPCEKPEDFVTNPQARSYFERRLRYIASRWAYSPSLFAWEWWNEANWTPISNDSMKQWIQAMTPVLKANDPYGHLISTSYANGANPDINNLLEIDFAQLHLYDSNDPAFSFPDLADQWNQQIPAKPILFAEFGASAGIEDSSSLDRGGLHLHNGLWAATFIGFASPAMYWWWDLYIDPLNLWSVYGRLNRFLAGEDLAALQPVKPALNSRDLPYRALGNDKRLLVWFHDRKNNIYYLDQARNKLIVAGKKPGPDWIYQPEPISGFLITITTLKDGAYTAYWYQPMRGKWLSRTAVSVKGGSAELELPTLTGDLALKIIPANEQGPAVDQ